MSENLVTALIAAVAGLLSGAIGSLVGPLLQGRLEDKRALKAHRRKLMDSWRTRLGSKEYYCDDELLAELFFYLGTRDMAERKGIRTTQRPLASSNWLGDSDLLVTVLEMGYVKGTCLERLKQFEAWGLDVRSVKFALLESLENLERYWGLDK